MISGDVLDDAQLYVVVTVDEDDSKARHGGKATRELQIDHASAARWLEGSPSRSDETMLGGYVEGRLNGDLRA